MNPDSSTLTTTEERAHARRVLMVATLFGLAVAYTLAFATTSHAAQAIPDPTAYATTALEYVKKLWVFVIIAEIIAGMIYAFAFFTQSIIPSLFQTFQGDWVKKALIIGVAVHPVLLTLLGAATTALSTGLKN